MNTDYENNLEKLVDRQLKALPELRAPDTLMRNVLGRIAARRAMQVAGWQGWSLPAKAVSLTVLTMVFAGICWGTWNLLHTSEIAAAGERVHAWYSAVGLVWGALTTVVQSLFAGLRQLGTGYLAGLFAAACLGYSVVVGLTTVYLRLAFARR